MSSATRPRSAERGLRHSLVEPTPEVPSQPRVTTSRAPTPSHRGLPDERVVAATIRIAAVACVSVAVIAVVATAVAVCTGRSSGSDDLPRLREEPRRRSSVLVQPRRVLVRHDLAAVGRAPRHPVRPRLRGDGGEGVLGGRDLAALLTTVWALQRLVGSWLAAAIGCLGRRRDDVLERDDVRVRARRRCRLGVPGLRRRCLRADETGAAGLGAAWAVTVLARPDAVVLVVCQAWRSGSPADGSGPRGQAARGDGGARRDPRRSLLRRLEDRARRILGVERGTLLLARGVRVDRQQASRTPPRRSTTSAKRRRPRCALLGLALFAGPRSWLRTFGWSAIVGYGVLLTVVVPATNEVERYFTPVAPVIAAGVANLLVRAVRRLPEPASTRSGCRLSRSGAQPCSRQARSRRPGRSLSARAVPERLRLHIPGDHRARVREILNRVAPPGARVLTYEVQGRYYARDDLRYLSLDGLTDAKVAPYLHTLGADGVPRSYRPRYWVANDAVEYRPYLARSPSARRLHRVQGRSNADESDRRGVEFRALVPDEPDADRIVGLVADTSSSCATRAPNDALAQSSTLSARQSSKPAASSPPGAARAARAAAGSTRPRSRNSRDANVRRELAERPAQEAALGRDEAELVASLAHGRRQQVGERRRSTTFVPPRSSAGARVEA